MMTEKGPRLCFNRMKPYQFIISWSMYFERFTFETWTSSDEFLHPWRERNVCRYRLWLVSHSDGSYMLPNLNVWWLFFWVHKKKLNTKNGLETDTCQILNYIESWISLWTCPQSFVGAYVPRHKHLDWFWCSLHKLVFQRKSEHKNGLKTDTRQMLNYAKPFISL